MFSQKRGISDVVTVSLIILLAIAAVVIVWSFVRPTLEGTGQQISNSGDCLALNVKAVTCDAVGGYSVVVENGAGAVTAGDIRLVYSGPTGSQTVTTTGCTSLSPLSSRTCAPASIPDLNGATVGNGITMVAAAGVLGTNNVCAVSTAAVNC